MFLRKLKEQVSCLISHMQWMDQKVRWLDRTKATDEQKIAHFEDQYHCLKVRMSLCEVVLINLLARTNNCFVGHDYYLDRLQEIRSTDPDSNLKKDTAEL